MESYSLPMLFAALILIWWFSWSPWRKNREDQTKRDDDTPPDRSGLS